MKKMNAPGNWCHQGNLLYTQLANIFFEIAILYFDEAMVTQLYLHVKPILWRRMLQF